MQGKTHAASAAFVSSGLVYLTRPEDMATAAGFIGVATVAAYLPDLDHPNSTASRKLGVFRKLPSMFLRHRGLTHSFLGVAGLTVLLAFVPGLPLWVAAGVLLGCLVHILGDMLTVSGCPILWPSKTTYRLARFTTGKWPERLILFPLFTAGAAWFAGSTIGALS